MSQEKSWEREYSKPKMISLSEKPLSAFLSYLKHLRKVKKINVAGLVVLDLGSGVGRNANYLAQKGALVTGIEISKEATRIAQERATAKGLKTIFTQGSIGAAYPFPDNSFDLLIDATSSNALNESERAKYLKESFRVLKPAGSFFVRALLKDGDKNAQNLIKKSPGPESDTYFMPELGLTERVFTEKDFIETYGRYFEIEKLTKTEGRVTILGKVFKRRYLVAYLTKK